MNDWIFTAEELANSPSRKDGLSFKKELIYRKEACDFIEKLSKILKLSKVAQITATTYLHRFYMRQSFLRYDMFFIGASSLYLSSKVEECFVNLHTLVREFSKLQKQMEKTRLFTNPSDNISEITENIIQLEGFLLHILVYDLTIIHPYKYINEKVDAVLQLFQSSSHSQSDLNGKIKQVAWSILNDSAYTCACLRLQPHDLAAGAVYVAGMYDNHVPNTLFLENGKPWWTVLSTSYNTLKDAATFLLEAYTEPYIDTRSLPLGLGKLVYYFHPKVASPMDSLCVTSPESNSVDRSPLDQDFPELKMKEFASPSPYAQLGGNGR